MALYIIGGRSGTGKSTFCINLMQEAIEQEKPAFLLVPEQYSLQAEARYLKETKSQGLMANEILSFKRMAFRVLSNYGGLAKAILNPSGKIMILNHVIQSHNEDLTFLKNLHEKQGEINRLLTLIDEFGRYEISPEILYLASEEAKDKNLKEKLRDLGLIYGKYRDLLLNNHIDDQDIYEAFLQRLKEYRPYEGAQIFLDSFAGFTAYEFDIIKELLKQAANVYICLSIDEEADFIFERVEKTYWQLSEICKEIACGFNRIQKKENFRFKNNPYLAHLEKNFASYPAKKLTGQPLGIEIRECKNKYEELESVARAIVKLLREEGLRYKDIAISARNLADYEKIINAVFPKYDIPYFLDLKKNIEDHPLIRLIFSLLDIIAGSWDYSSIFDFLKTGLYLNNKESIDILENYVLERGIRGKREWSKAFDLEDEYNEVRQKIYDDLASFEEDFRRAKTIGDLARSLVSFFERLNIQESIERKTNRLREENQAILSNEYARIWNISMEVVEQIYIFLKDMKLPGTMRLKARYFKDVLRSGFSEYKIGFIPYTDDSVQLGSADRTRSHNIKALFLLGANEGVFPANLTDQGFLKDGDRRFLSERGIELAEDNGTKAKMEYNYIYNTITSASCYLYISYSLKGDDQSSMRPSVIVKRIESLFPDLKIIRDYRLGIEDKLTRPNPFLLDNISHLKDDKGPLAGAIKHWYKESDQYKELFKGFMEADRSFKRDVYLEKELMDELFHKNIYLSASQIEKYNSCPYAYFMNYGIKAKKRKENLIEATDIGNLMHDLMDKAGKKSEKGIDDSDKILDSVFDECLVKIGIRSFLDNQRNLYLANRLLRHTKEAFKKSLEQIDSGLFKPVAYEHSFEKDGDLNPITIDVDGVKLSIRGRIDRYDAYENDDAIYFRVIDYKSSDNDIKAGDILSGQKLQLITYIEAVASDYEEKSSKKIIPAAAFYFTLQSDINSLSERPIDGEDIKAKSYHMKGLAADDPEILSYMIKDAKNPLITAKGNLEKGFSLNSSLALPKEGFTLLRKELRRAIRNTYRQMAKGCINISPTYYAGNKACKYCDFNTICGLDRSNLDNFRKIASIDNKEALETMGLNDS